MDARRRPDAALPRARLARAPRRLRVIRGNGADAPPAAPRDLPAALASLVLPGLGQLIQGRRRAAALQLAVGAAIAAVWLLDGATRHVSLPLLVVCMLASAADAARYRPRPPLRRA